MSQVASTFLGFQAAYWATLAMGAVCGGLGLLCLFRRIVFTGAALAQLAAAGAAAALFLAVRLPEPAGALVERWGPTAGSLLCSLLGALGLRGRGLDPRAPADARVGMVYSGAAGLAVLLVWRSGSGPAELANILAGEVLLARPGELLALVVGLAAVAAVNTVCRRELLLVSFDPEFARASGLPVRRLELLFLGSLALAVALSLQVGGLLLTFAFLVLSPLVGLLLGRTTREVALLAPAAALGATLVGFLFAIAGDLPVAPTVATALLGLVALAFAAGRGTIGPRLARGGVLLLAAAALLLPPLLALFVGRPPETEVPSTPAPAATRVAPPPHSAAHEEQLAHDLARVAGAPSPEERAHAAGRLGQCADPRALEALLPAQLDEDARVRTAVDGAIRRIAKDDALHDRLHRALTGPDPEQRALAALGLASAGERAGLAALVDLLAAPEVAYPLRAEAVLRLRALRTEPERPRYEPELDPLEQAEALSAWRAWWEAIGPCLEWDPAQERFLRAHPPDADPHGPGR